MNFTVLRSIIRSQVGEIRNIRALSRRLTNGRAPDKMYSRLHCHIGLTPFTESSMSSFVWRCHDMLFLSICLGTLGYVFTQISIEEGFHGII
ncbi:hypothetical protein NPIL_583481 [Nephila pilipes]|uniref:Uncharacterized protein n=1 Tax=Nephila pilipes TaxID=299642 RepID=A0A8X6UGD5_NEPPI|nr:hypothetical protein NPIL_583481 [Nephila pilipes]